jgi:hypothetical protein
LLRFVHGFALLFSHTKSPPKKSRSSIPWSCFLSSALFGPFCGRLVVPPNTATKKASLLPAAQTHSLTQLHFILSTSFAPFISLVAVHPVAKATLTLAKSPPAGHPPKLH